MFQADGVLQLARYEFGRSDPDEWDHGAIERFAELMQTLTGAASDVIVSIPPGLPALRHALTHARCPVAVIADHPDWLLEE